MAQISSYPLLTPQLGDKILGSNTTDTAGNPVSGNPTVQYKFLDVKTLVYNDKFDAVNKPVPLIIPITVGITKELTTMNFQMACSGSSGYGLVKNASPINAAITPTFSSAATATITISKLI